MPKEGKGNGAPKAPRKPREKKEVKDKPVRMSAKALLEIANGMSLKKDEPKVEVKDEAPVEFSTPDVIDKTEGADTEQEGTMTILEPEQPKVRKFRIDITVDQIGLKDREGNIVDPNNNILKKITFESEGDNVDIAKAAGRIANELYSFYSSIKGKGIVRQAGFNVNLNMVDEINGEKNWQRLTVVDKLRMNNSIDVAYAVGNSILRQMEGENADGLLTGDFSVSNDGQMFLRKLKFDANRLNMPIEQIYKLLDEKRKIVKGNASKNFKELRESMVK